MSFAYELRTGKLRRFLFVTLRTLTPIVENGDENGGEEESKKTQNTDVSEKES